MGSAGQVRQEEMANRLLLVEDEVARRRVAAAIVSPSPNPSPNPSTATPSPVTPSSATPSAPTPSAKSLASDPELPVVRLEPRDEDGERRAIVTASESPPTAAPAPAPAAAPAPAPALPAPLAEPPLLSAKELYAQGLAAFRSSDLARARHIFAAVLKRFPEHSLADNALYWTGRAHAAANDHRAAITAYETLLERYPTGNKVPDALLALSTSLRDAGRGDDARRRLALLAKNFPATTAAKQARARLREMKQ